MQSVRELSERSSTRSTEGIVASERSRFSGQRSDICIYKKASLRKKFGLKDQKSSEETKRLTIYCPCSSLLVLQSHETIKTEIEIRCLNRCTFRCLGAWKRNKMRWNSEALCWYKMQSPKWSSRVSCNNRWHQRKLARTLKERRYLASTEKSCKFCLTDQPGIKQPWQINMKSNYIQLKI